MGVDSLVIDSSMEIQPLPYFFAYKTVFFFFQNNPKNLDPSYKMDLDLSDCLGRVKPVLQQNLIICTHSREGKPVL